MKITLAQLNPIIGDFKGNLSKIEITLSSVQKDKPDLVIFPELFLMGYPPRDLLERNDFIDKAATALTKLLYLSEQYPHTGILCGHIRRTHLSTGNGLYNSALLIQKGKILFEQHKSLLPTYDVFDEARYFDSAKEVKVFPYRGERLGISICEDAWNDPEAWPNSNYFTNPIEKMAFEKASIIINLSASPFCKGKEKVRYHLIQNHIHKYRVPFILVNQVGGNDELIFDGCSMAFDDNGNLITLLPSFREAVQTIDLSRSSEPIPYHSQDELVSVYDALILGLKDYMFKCGFKKAVLGLSGGIDSALVACIASSALGTKNVTGISMPSMYTSRASIDDAAKLAENLSIPFKVIPITDTYNQFCHMLSEHFKNSVPDITEENIQARIRGNILMAISNKFKSLTLSTGNKSELSVGYCTLYGDMSGGLSVIADVPKTMVYKLSKYINRDKEIIPQSIIEKPPSAELKPDQKDEDTLPPYEILDHVLHLYLDQELSKKEIIQTGIHKETVKWIIDAINRSEYKRRQAAPGLKVTSKAFGMGRRMPIAAKY